MLNRALSFTTQLFQSSEKKLLLACQNGNVEQVKQLLQEQNIDVNIQDSLNKTPFYYACFKGSIEIVKLLLNDKRVDFNQGNMNNTQPFGIACYNGHIEVVKLLLKDDRIEVDKANQGWTPFDIACWDGDTEIILVLLASGRIDIKNGQNSIDILRENELYNLVKVLEEYEKNPKEKIFELRKELGFLSKFFLLIFYSLLILLL